MSRAALAAAAALALVSAAPNSAAAAELTVGSGSTWDLGTGQLDLGCTDLRVGGTFSAGTVGFLQGRDVAIDPGGVVNGNSATLALAGDWDNAGTFNAGTSTVQMVDGCSLLSAVIAGNTTFANLQMTTASGFQRSFTAGSTQTVTSSLQLVGVSGNLLKVRSTLGGSAAFLNVSGTSSANYADVQDSDATAGNDLALALNSIKGTNTPGWTIGPSLLVNELDSDTPGADTAEFIEFFGPPSTSLTGLVLVLFNGADDLSYQAFDLDGQSTDAGGFFVAGNVAVPNTDLVIANNLVQNGADAAALFVGDGSAFPNGTPVTEVNLIDALAYDTNDADDAGLLAALTPGQPQQDENAAGNQEAHSLSRLPNGSGLARQTTTVASSTPTPGAINMPEPGVLVSLGLGFGLLLVLRRRADHRSRCAE